MKKLLLSLLLLMPLALWAEEQGYAVFNESTGTLTFMYGEKPAGENVYDTDNTPPVNDYAYWFNNSWLGNNYEKAKKLKTVIFDSSFKNARPKSTSAWFYNCKELSEIRSIGYLNFSEIKDISCMFSSCSKLENIDLSSFDTKNVTDMRMLFQGCSKLKDLDLSAFNTEKVTDMSGMFSNCSNLSDLDLKCFNTSNVNDMGSMFNGCSSLQSLDLSTFNTANVTDMSYMFKNCRIAQNIDVRNFNTSKVTNMKGMFLGCYNLQSLDISSFDTSNVTEMGDWAAINYVTADEGMFMGCSNLKKLDLSNFNTSKVTNMGSMFSSCWSLEELNISSFDTSNVTNMSNMFNGCESIETLNISNFDTGNVTSMHGMFGNCKKLINLDLSNIETHNVEDMGGMFWGCAEMKSIDLSHFNTKKVKSMDDMFARCTSLQTIDLSPLNTENVKYMGGLFSYCTGLKSVDLSTLKTDNVTSMGEMFRFCSNLTSIDLQPLNTENVVNMYCMFDGCTSLENVSLNGLNTKNLDVMTGMFSDCINLHEVDFGSFDTSNLTSINRIFYNCKNLATLTFGPNFNTGLVTNSKEAFVNCNSLSKVVFTGDIPVAMKSDIFAGIGSMVKPVLLEVPDLFRSSYQSKFENGMFYGGYFHLPGDDNDTPVIEPSIPQFNSKKLLSITQTNGYSSRTGVLDYDDQGRVVKYTMTQSGKTSEFNYNYSENAVEITRVGSRGTDTYNFTIEDGRITSAHWFLAGDNLTEDMTYDYDSDKHLVKVNETVSPKNISTFYDYQWNGENRQSLSLYKNNALRATEEYTYNDMTSEPLVHALFGFGLYGAGTVYIDEEFATMALYPYMGTLPRNLYSSILSNDIYSDHTSSYTYNFTYKTNANGDIVEVTIDDTTYSLEWDGSEITPVNTTFTIGDLIYTKLDDSRVTVAAAHTGISGEVQIPSMVRDGESMYSVAAIADNGFQGCYWMTGLTMPASITEIGSAAFWGCSGLEQLTLHIAEPISISADVFDGVDKARCILNVPEGSGDLYRSAEVWKEFWLIAAPGDIIVEGITYTLNADGSAIIVSANRTASGRYEIPSMVVIDGQEHEVTAIGTRAFENCADMTAVTIPQSIGAIGDKAFAECLNLMEVFALGTNPPNLNGLFARRKAYQGARRKAAQFDGVDLERCLLYVPFGFEDVYRAAEGWKEFKNIVGVHGETDPAVIVTGLNYERAYGDENPAFGFNAEGGVLDGQPEILCEATSSSPVGTYPIVVKKGSVANYNDEYVNGTLTVTKAPLTVTAVNASREQYEDNPDFIITYSGWKNADDESVLTAKPKAKTDATKDSPVGEYSITVYGGEAQNYELVYVDGTLTVTESTAIQKIVSSGKSFDIYNLHGVKVKQDAVSLDGLAKGVYIINGQKVVVR